jgi:hypothetical protein
MVYNGVPAGRQTLAQRIEHRARMKQYARNLFGFEPDYVFTHVARPVCDRSAAELEARELVPFRANLEAGAVMTAHVTFPALDPESPATLSAAICGHCAAWGFPA